MPAYRLNREHEGWVSVMSSPSSSSWMMKDSRGEDTRQCLESGSWYWAALNHPRVRHKLHAPLWMLGSDPSAAFKGLLRTQVALTCSDAHWAVGLNSEEAFIKYKRGVSATGTLTDNNPAGAHEPDLLLERDPPSRLLLSSILGGARRAAPLSRTVRHRDVWTCIFFVLSLFFMLSSSPPHGTLCRLVSRLGPVRYLRALKKKQKTSERNVWWSKVNCRCTVSNLWRSQ